MSGKRSLKKQQKRQESALEELEALLRRGTDDRFLARAAELFPDPSASLYGARWAEAADRALRQSLARADFIRLESLLRSLRRTGRPRPFAVLAEAVLDLAAGRRTAARSKLAPLDPAGHPAPELLAALQAIARGELQKDLYQQAADELLRACRGLEACAFAPSAADRETLARCLHTLRGTAPADESHHLDRLLESAERCLRLLDDLAALDAGLMIGREDSAPRASETVLAWLRGAGAAALAAVQANVGTTGTTGTPLLATLHYAAHSRWRAVLERVLAQEGAAGLAVLCAAEPKLLLADVDLTEGTQEGLAALRKRAQAEQLAAGCRYGDLAVLLRNRSRTATTESEAATVWGLELWARGLPDRPEDEEDEEDDFDLPEEPRANRTLVRLEEMAAEIGTRFSPAHRAEIAGVLRGELFTLCEKTRFCEHTAGTALSLLEHESGGAGETGLLIAGVAGAVTAGDHRALRALRDRLSRRSKTPAGDHRQQDVVRRLMIGVAHERPSQVARILDVLRPLFDGGWPEMAVLVAGEMGGGLALELTEVTLVAEDDRELARMLGDVRHNLFLLRPALAETPGLAAMELLLECWLPDRRAAEKSLAAFLSAAPDLAAPLTAARMFEKALVPWTPPGIAVAFEGLVRAAIERLDESWQLWCDDVPLLARASDSGSLRRLEEQAKRLLTGAPREKALAEIREIEDMRRPAKRSDRRGLRPSARKTRKTPRRERAPQLPFDVP